MIAYCMAYDMLPTHDGRLEVRCTSGKSAHMYEAPDGTRTVDEDEQQRVFPNRGAALDCARQIANDTDFG
jgi:hypothetical protein